ncbi:MAG: arginyltransferase [Gammaproteobacteria bacterium]|nr:arginyltransferase [Gammaproteobacteria bacterium]
MNDRTKISFFASSPEPCSYLKNKKSISAFANPYVDMEMHTYNTLITHGFRRSGGYVYRPHCTDCKACISVRIPVKAYQFSKSEKRTIKRNQDIDVFCVKDKFKSEHFDLYCRYLKSRHEDSSMSNPTKTDYHRFLICDWSETLFFEFRLNKVLIGVAVTDIVDDGLSAVYTFFDPDHEKRSLGHFSILTQIQQAQNRGLSHLYLGYWIDKCQKMAYKKRYQQLEAFIDEHWQSIL